MEYSMNIEYSDAKIFFLHFCLQDTGHKSYIVFSCQMLPFFAKLMQSFILM